VLCELNAYDISVQYGQDPPADATRLVSRTWGRECGIEITQRGQRTLDFSDTEDILEIERQFNDPDVEEQLDFHQTDQRWGAEMTALASHEMHARDLNIYFVPKLYEIGGDLRLYGYAWTGLGTSRGAYQGRGGGCRDCCGYYTA
jgi:hypothetical protein